MRKIFSFFYLLPIPLVIFIISFLSFALLIPWLGFYMDDWFTLLNLKAFGSGSFVGYLAGDRPLMGWVYQVFVPLFRDSALAWHLFSFLSFTLAACSFWLLLKKLLPLHSRIVNTAALLFAVFPGFLYHWVSILYGQIFFLLAIYIWSFILMIEAVRAHRHKRLLILGALVCLLLGVIPQEYFFGFEFVRPFLLASVLKTEGTSTAKVVRPFWLAWMPYFILDIGFVIFRLAATGFYAFQPVFFNEFIQAPWQNGLLLFSRVLDGLQTSLLNIWVDLLKVFNRDLFSTTSLAMLGLMLAAGVLVLLRLRPFYKKQDSSTPRSTSLLWLGFLALIASMLPFLSAGLELSNDRFLIALAPAASVIVAILVDLLWNKNWQKWVFLSILIGLAVGGNFITARSLMLNFKAQQDFFWQLVWRVPELEPGTALVTGDLPFSTTITGNSLSAPLNLIYDSVDASGQLAYALMVETDPARLSLDNPEGSALNWQFRSFSFEGDSAKLLVIKKSGDGCLRIIRPDETAAEIVNSDPTGFWQAAAQLSKPQLINSGTTNPLLDAKLFGSENQDQWCYYFEKADLARQNGQWDQTIQLYEQAEAAGFSPVIASEWHPLLEAYLHTGQIDQAVSLTQKITGRDTLVTAGFCRIWQNAKSDPVLQPTVDEMLSWLACSVK